MTLDARHQHLCSCCSEPWECEVAPDQCREPRVAICQDCEDAEAIALMLLQPMDAGLPM